MKLAKLFRDESQKIIRLRAFGILFTLFWYLNTSNQLRIFRMIRIKVGSIGTEPAVEGKMDRLLDSEHLFKPELHLSHRQVGSGHYPITYKIMCKPLLDPKILIYLAASINVSEEGTESNKVE